MKLLESFAFSDCVNYTFFKLLSEAFVWPFHAFGCFFSHFQEKATLIGVDIFSINGYQILSLFEEGQGFNSEELLEIFNCTLTQTPYKLIGSSQSSLVVSMLKLGSTFLIFTRTKQETTICLVSKDIHNERGDHKFWLPILVFPQGIVSKSLKLNPNYEAIFKEFMFLIGDERRFVEHLETLKLGTTVYFKDSVFGEKQASMTTDRNDVCLFSTISDSGSLIDFSLKTYLSYLFLQSSLSLSFFGSVFDLRNPLSELKNLSRLFSVKSSKEFGFEEADFVTVEEDEWQGFFTLRKFFKSAKLLNFTDDAFLLENHNNGVIVYCDNKLICRLGQDKFGNEAYLVDDKLKDRIIVSGYVKVTSEKISGVSDSFDYTSNVGFKELLFRVNSQISRFFE